MIFADPAFAAQKNIVHGFTSILDVDGQRLDLGRGSTSTDWARAARSIGADDMGTAFVSQVHGKTVLWAEQPGLVGEADAVLTRVPGLLVAVRTADCVPILVAGKTAVGAIHAGWRGLAAGATRTTFIKKESQIIKNWFAQKLKIHKIGLPITPRPFSSGPPRR